MVWYDLEIKEIIPAYLNPDFKDDNLVTGVSCGSGLDDLISVNVDVFTNLLVSGTPCPSSRRHLYTIDAIDLFIYHFVNFSFSSSIDG